MFKELLEKSEKITKFWIRSYIYIFVLCLISAPLGSSAFTTVFFVIIIVFIVILSLNFYRSFKIIEVLKKIEKISLEKNLKEHIRKLRLSITISAFADIPFFTIVFTIFTKVYFYYTLNSLKIFLGLIEKQN